MIEIFDYRNIKIGEVEGNTYYTTRHLFGIFDGFAINFDTINKLLSLGVNEVNITYNSYKFIETYVCPLSRFIDSAITYDEFEDENGIKVVQKIVKRHQMLLTKKVFKTDPCQSLLKFIDTKQREKELIT